MRMHSYIKIIFKQVHARQRPTHVYFHKIDEIGVRVCMSAHKAINN